AIGERLAEPARARVRDDGEALPRQTPRFFTALAKHTLDAGELDEVVAAADAAQRAAEHRREHRELLGQRRARGQLVDSIEPRELGERVGHAVELDQAA